MKFKIEKEVFDKFPTLVVAIPVILGFDNTKSKDKAVNILRKEEKELKERYSLKTLFEDNKVTSYLEAFRKFGMDPEKRLPAHVALSKRVLDGGNLPNINPIVNLYNGLSIKYTTPFGGEDLDTLYGDFVLKFATGGERWIPIGGGKPKQMVKGDLVWGDDLDISTPSLNWRQCERTKMVSESKNGYFIMDGFSDVNKEIIKTASEEFLDLATKLFGGKGKIYWLDKDNPEIEAPFDTKDVKNLKQSNSENESEVKKKDKYFGWTLKIAELLNKATGEDKITVSFPRNDDFGDYTTNIAWQVSKKLKMTPKEAGLDIVGKIKEDIFENIEATEDGFINFWLIKDILIDNMMSIDRELENYGNSDYFKNKKIMFEFAHPNTHKAFHIGHLRNITTGETLSRLHQAVGAEVVRVNYQGDIGLHIAKAIYGIQLIGFEDPGDIKHRAEYLGKAYAEGATKFEESDQAKEIVADINKKIYEKTDPEINKLYYETRSWSLEYFELIYKRVYVNFDRLYFESECAKSGKKIALDALKKGILEESEGAIIFKGSKYGLHDRVFVSGKGVPTYEGKDLGLAVLQFGEFNPDLLVHVVGPEQSEYFKVIIKTLEFIMPETKGKELHVPYGWVRLKEGKMSSRTGNVILGEAILDEAKANIIRNYKTEEKTAEKIAIAAIKYSFLKNGLNQDIAFDLKESISLEGNSGPYLQYTYARTRSVLRMSKIKKLTIESKNVGVLAPEELAVLRKLSQFSEVIVNAAKSYSPNILATYLYELASKYNTFYNKHKIIGGDNEIFKLLLTKSTGQVIKNGLNLLGIEAPEKM